MSAIEPHLFADDGHGYCKNCPLPQRHAVHLAPTLPETPYAGTSGWSGSDTSRERAEDADADGTTSARQSFVLSRLATVQANGLTWRDLATEAGWHHGQASGALSVLHKEGRIARLAEERRTRCAVYVLPEYVEGRPVAAHGRKSPVTEAESVALASVEIALAEGSLLNLSDVRLVAAALRRSL
jgi:hypothetical protein